MRVFVDLVRPVARRWDKIVCKTADECLHVTKPVCAAARLDGLNGSHLVAHAGAAEGDQSPAFVVAEQGHPDEVLGQIRPCLMLRPGNASYGRPGR